MKCNAVHVALKSRCEIAYCSEYIALLTLLKHQVEIIEFRNFELGVLFHSSKFPGIEYRSFDPCCKEHHLYAVNGIINRDIPGSNIILLPLPYDLFRGESYYCPDTAVFQHRPFMSNSEEVLK